MKKLIKIAMISIFTIICGLFTSVFANTYNVNDQVDLGEYNIYYREGPSYIRYKGVGQLNYMYFYRDYNNVEHKAFCLNLGISGAEDGNYRVDANKLIQEPVVSSILISGSPYKTLKELGLNNEDEASFATQFAVWAYIEPLDLNEITPYASGNENVVNAIKKIYNDGIALSKNYTTEAILNISKENEAGIDSIDRNSYSQIYNISHNNNIKNIMLSTMGIDNVKITDINNNVIDNINNVNKFKVLIPRASVTENKELLLNFRVESQQTSVMFGATKLGGRQNVGLLLDPVNIKSIQDKFTVNYITSKIDIKKVDKDTGVGIKGVTFRFETLDGVNLGEYKTDDNGVIELDAQKDLKVLKEQQIKVTEIAVPDNYTIDEENNSKIVDIVWGKNISLEFKNEHKKGNIKVYKVDKDNNKIVLGNVEFQLYSHEFQKTIGTYYTDVNGELYIENLRIGDYSLIETKTNQWYNLAEDVQVEVEWNLTSELKIENELKKAAIKVIKVDNENNEIKLKNVKFNIMDKDGNVLEQIITDENGEATTRLYPVRDFQELKLQEIETLENYVLNDEIKTIQLEENQVKNIVFENEKIKGQIKIIKISANDNKLTGEKKGAALAGATFNILDENGNVVDTLVTNEDGIAISELLLKGKYKIVEKDSGSPFYLVNSDIFEVEIVEHKQIVDVTIEDESVDIDIEIEKTGFIETQNKDNIFYDFKNIHNKSNVPLDHFTWNDTLPTDAVRLDKIYTGTWNEKLEYEVWYKTNKEDFKLFRDKLDTETVYELDFNKLELQDDEYITEFEFRFGTVKVDFHEIESPIVYVNVLDGLKNGYTFTNNTKVSGDYLGKNIEDKDKWTTIIYTKNVIKGKELPKTGM